MVNLPSVILGNISESVWGMEAIGVVPKAAFVIKVTPNPLHNKPRKSNDNICFSIYHQKLRNYQRSCILSKEKERKTLSTANNHQYFFQFYEETLTTTSFHHQNNH